MNPFMTQAQVTNNNAPTNEVPVIGAAVRNVIDAFATQKLGYYAQEAINAKQRVLLQERLAARIAAMK